ncbi:MAG: CoA transferase, partial [Actinomycetota bacterium]|nr:CoA transferase [Actinomycetota bacterium]
MASESPIPTGRLIAAATQSIQLVSGVRVIDVGDETTTYGATLLAEVGAEVIRIEQPDGDTIRSEPWRNATHNAGKRSITCPSRTTALPADLQRLVAGADLVIGPLVATPLTDAVLAAATEASVSTITTVDRRGQPPRPTTDLTAMAAGGHLTLNGDPQDPPAVPAGELAWTQTSLTVFYAGMGLLTSALANTPAAHVEVSVQEAVSFTTLQTANSNHYTWHQHIPSRHERPADFSTVQTGDGSWVSFTIHPPYWDRFVTWAESVLGPLGLTGPEWEDPEYVLRARNLVGKHVRALAATLTAPELTQHGQSLGLLVLPVHDATGVSTDPHLTARDYWEQVDTPDGPVTLPGSPFRTTSGRASRGTVPAIGEATPSDFRPLPTRPATTALTPADPNQPLAGVRVVDFCWAIAGPLTTRLLASLGAEVIKIESEHRFDPIRLIGNQPGETKSLNTNGVFNDCNTNKRVVTINVDTDEGRELAWQLIETADVITANYSPERLDVWGFGWDELQARNPRLIAANLAVMGMSGPNLGWRSYGSGIVAMCGLARHSNPDNRTPDCLGTLHTDFTVPYMGAGAIMAALQYRNRTGEGLYLELAQYETAVRLMDAETAGALAGAPPGPRVLNRTARHAPNVVAPCSDEGSEDSWVALTCRDDTEWTALQRIVPGLGDLDRWADQEAAEAAIAGWTSTRDKFNAAALLTEAGIPAAAVEHLGDHRTPGSPLYHYWSPDQHDGVD